MTRKGCMGCLRWPLLAVLLYAGCRRLGHVEEFGHAGFTISLPASRMPSSAVYVDDKGQQLGGPKPTYVYHADPPPLGNTGVENTDSQSSGINPRLLPEKWRGWGQNMYDTNRPKGGVDGAR